MPRYQIKLFLEDMNNSNGPYNFQPGEEPSPNCVIILHDSDYLDDAIRSFKEILDMYGLSDITLIKIKV